MKIVIITETFLPSTDGIVTRLVATIRWLRDEGHRITVIAPDLGVDEFEGVRVEGMPARYFFLYRSKKLSMPNRKVGRLLRELQPDLVHVVNPAMLGVAGIYFARRLRLPLVASYHTQIPKYADYYRVSFLKPALWWWFRTLHNRAELNLCTSRSVQDELTAKRFRNVQLWKRGVSAEDFGPRYRNEEMRNLLSNGQPDKTVLLYVGRLAAEKEIERIRDVLDESPDYCLAIVGDGPHRAGLEAYFQGRNATFTGFLHGERLAQAYASSDLFLFPSTTETLGLVILEAMASGLPVIAGMSGPTCEQVEDGVTGLLYDPDKPGGLTEAVSRAAEPDMRRRISESSLEAARRLGWSEPSAQLLDFYKQLLKHSAVPANARTLKAKP